MLHTDHSAIPAYTATNKAGIVQLDLKATVLFCNNVAHNLLAVQGRQIIQRPLLELVPENSGNVILQKIEEAVYNDAETAVEVEWYRGHTYVYCVVTPAPDFILLQLYPTSFSRFEQRLNEQLDYLNHIASTLPDMVSVFEIKTRKLVYTNKAPYLAHGFDYKKMQQMDEGERLTSFLHPDDREPTANYFKAFESMDADGVQSIEYRAKNDFNEWQWYKSRGKVFMFDDHNNPSHCINIVQNISPRKKVEESIRKNLAIMQQAEELALLGSWEYDLMTGSFVLSAGLYELFGLDHSEIVTPDIYLRFAAAGQQAIAQQIVDDIQIHHQPFEQILHIKTGNGIKAIRLKAIAADRDSFRTLKMLGVNMDITDIIRAENDLKFLNNSLNERNKELEEKNEELSAFAFIASHDLKEPLRKIHTFSSWLTEKEMYNLSDQGKAYLTRMQNSVSRMDLLINDILTLLRLEDKQQQQEDIDLNLMLKRCVDEFEGEIAESKARIECRNLGVIKGFSSINYLFNNLIGNSLKFRHKDRAPNITVTGKIVKAADESIMHRHMPGNYYVLSFSDNGIGFEKQYSQLIFQMFQRLHGKAEYAGTGIGLTICKKVMETHQGFIAAESVPGEGSAFHCYFPLI